MSLIRSGSNPEGLYVWGDGNFIYLCPGRDYPFTNTNQLKIPRSLFYRTVEKWFAKQPDPSDGPVEVDGFKIGPVEVDGFKIGEVVAYRGTGELVPIPFIKEKNNIVEGVETWFPVRVEYQDKYILMWYVTWMYVVEGALRHIEEDKQIDPH